MTQPDDKYEISDEWQIDRYIRAFFRCNFCGAEHAFPSTSEWALESELKELLEGPTTLCPGNMEAMLAPHYEPMKDGKPISHAQQFELIDIILKQDDD